MLPMLLISVTVLMLVTYISEIGGAALRGCSAAPVDQVTSKASPPA
jgi:hypothetical protein